VRAFFGGNEVFSTGVVPQGTPMVEVQAADPYFWRLGDEIFDAGGNVTHMFWDAASVTSNLLLAPNEQMFTPGYIDNHMTRTFMVPSIVDRVKTAIHIQPIGHDVIDDLIASDDLDPIYRERIETFTLGATRVVWTPDAAVLNCVPEL
jgi:hypothetical protein